MKQKLWIDDIRNPPDDSWTWAKTSTEAFKALQNNTFDLISFDHDLGENDTSIAVANYIEELAYFNTMKRIKWKIHSANPVGAARLSLTLTSADRWWDKHNNGVGSDK